MPTTPKTPKTPKATTTAAPAADKSDPDAMAPGEADDLLASMADDAIDRMLAGGPTDGAAESDATSSAIFDEDDVSLTAAERDALSEIEQPAPQATAPLPQSEAELDALLAGESMEMPHAAQALSAELELDAQESPSLAESEPVSPQAIEVKDTQGARSSAWLLPLIWLNAPLRNASPGVRDAIGKVALITLLNATGLFIYGVLRG